VTGTAGGAPAAHRLVPLPVFWVASTEVRDAPGLVAVSIIVTAPLAIVAIQVHVQEMVV
jgi:hypothetical protein